MKRHVKCLAAAFLCGALAGGRPDSAAAGIIDSINPGASPLPRTVYAPPDIGWYYTPAFDYNLNGIFTFFEPIPNGTGDHTITVQIQTDRPVNGGTLLGQASFAGNSFSGGQLGADFSSPIALTAGHTYFVDFLNVGGMGTDFGQFAVAAGGTHVPSAGATTRLGAYYTDPPGSSSFIIEHAGNAGDQMLSTGNGSALEPILYFDGSTGGTTAVTPEPSTGIMMLMGLGGAFVLRRRRRRTAPQFGGTDRQRSVGRLSAAMKRVLPWTLLLLATTAGCGGSSAPSADKGRRALESLLDGAGFELVSFSKEDGQASVKDGVDRYRMHISARVRSKTGIAEMLSEEKDKRITGWLDFEKRESGWQLSDSNWQ